MTLNTDRHGCTGCRAVRDERDRLAAELDAAHNTIVNLREGIRAEHNEADHLAGELHAARNTIAEVAKAVGADHEDYAEVIAKARKTQAGLEKAREAETKTRRCNIELRADVESYRRRFLHVAKLLGVDVASLLDLDVASLLDLDSDDPREDVLAARVHDLMADAELGGRLPADDRDKTLAAAREEARNLDAQLKVAQARVVGLHAENLQLRRLMGVEP